MQAGVVIPIAFLGMLNGMGRDRGAASALEQAILPETTGPERRTWSLAWYNLGLDIGHASGALLAVLPAVLISWLIHGPPRAPTGPQSPARFARLLTRSDDCRLGISLS